MNPSLSAATAALKDGLKRKLFAMLRSEKTWLICTLLVLAVTAGLFAHRASLDRGLVTSSHWLIDASEQRVDYYRALWRGLPDEDPNRQGKKLATNRSLIDRSFAPQAAAPPLVPAIAATMLDRNAERSAAQHIQIVNAVLFACLVFLIGLMGLETGGSVGALTAALGAASIPRLFGLASVVGFGMAAVFFITLAIYLLYRTAKTPALALLAAPAIAAAIHATSFIGFFVWVPWLYTSITRPKVPTLTDGRTDSPPVPLWTIVAVAAGLFLALFAYPYIRFETKDHTIAWLTHFLRQPAEPFSYQGEIWGHRRIPWHAAPYLLAVTVPIVYLLLAAAGLRFGPRYRSLTQKKGLQWLRFMPFAPTPSGPDFHPLMRLAQVSLIIALTLPLLLRSPYFGGVDLIALALPWFLVFAAAGAARILPLAFDLIPNNKTNPLFSSLTQATAATLLFALLLGPPVLELARFHPFEEAYYSWIIGGPEGARKRALPRYPNGPVPNALEAEISNALPQRPVGVGFMLTRDRSDSNLRRAMQQRLIPDSFKLHPSVFDADIAVLPHDDLDPNYENALTDFYRTINDAPDSTLITFERGSVPIYSLGIVPRR